MVIICLVPATAYIMLSLPPIQARICSVGEQELSKLLNSPVSIERIYIAPFNRLTLRNVTIRDAQQDTALYVSRLGAGIDLSDLFFNDKIVITYAELIGLDARISKETHESPLNIQPIIDALKPKEKNKPPTLFDLRVNTIVIRKSCAKFDILSMPHDSTRLDKNHLAISDLKADIMLPRIKNDDFTVDIKRFALQEQSGFTLKDLKGHFNIASTGLATNDVNIILPNSKIMLADIDIKYNGWNELKNSFADIPFEVALSSGSHISPNDLCCIAPQLKEIDKRFDLECNVSGNLNALSINKFKISTPDDHIKINLSGQVDSLANIRNINVNIPSLTANASGTDITRIVASIKPLSSKNQKLINNLGAIAINGALKGNLKNASFIGDISTATGNINIDVDYTRASENSPIQLAGTVITPDINLQKLSGNENLGLLDSDINFDIAFNKNGYRKGNVGCSINNIDFKGYKYSDINASLQVDNNAYIGTLNIDDNNINIDATGDVILDKENSRFNLHADVKDVNFATLNIWEKHPDNRLSASIDANFSGINADNINGHCSVKNIKFIDKQKQGLIFDGITVETDNTSLPQYISVKSDVIEGKVEGSYNTATIIPTIKGILSHVFPILMATDDEHIEQLHASIEKISASRSNDFIYNFTLKDNEQLGKFFKTPVNIIYPISINGALSHSTHCLSFNINAPYLQQKDKLIKNTALHLNIDGINKQSQLYATTIFPTKKGPMSLLIDCNGQNDRIDSDISWDVQRERTFKGEVNFSTAFERDEENNLLTGIDINPSQLIFNDTTWVVNPAKIDIAGKYVAVNGFDVRSDDQFITMSGVASEQPGDSICLQLLNINLDYVFETLAINNVMFGGTASGTFYAYDIFSKTPRAQTPGLNVKNLSYNYATLGDAVILSQWKPEDKAITIDADISQSNGRKSQINGAIFPLNDSLDFNFNADKINIKFMKPFMQAFTSEIDGCASGKARLWGNFKYIDMTGDIFAEDLKLKLDFTNTYYYATDSIHLSPGYISFSDVPLKDDYGNSAKLSGWLKHECFKRPVFEFAVTDANNILCYDVTEKTSPIWYGRIFGYGSAFVTGHPGYVGINVNMSTAPNSTFTFVLSDSQEANEYSFLTFRDKDTLIPKSKPKTKAVTDTIPDIVKELEARIASSQSSSPSVYNMNIQVDVNPNAQMNLIMDPVGGDRIRANGSGNIRMEYDSANENLKMFGTYTLEKGNYNFTLQDIIIKEFSIRNGSSIAFQGDPYAAQLDIEAIYSVNANLSDLDESFLQDKDLNRTNVPVHALLRANGDMRQPEISFDLEFPTLTQDTYRKVKSIVSTEDMMNRQIIYLLALSRFYTPDYMESTTKGSELVSVASSTISSQLSSILGQLSDNWSIAPNVRSDRGDFSDVEVDLALSSTLLNNRLLFNGNFGYRDKTLNNNTFVGDFDIEYLLNKSGHIRLKAYNRYNDQNFYLKTASTTQGVGIVYRRDFDNIFSFMRPFLKKKKEKDDKKARIEEGNKVATDSIVNQPQTINHD